MPAQFVNAWIERHVRTAGSIGRQRAGHEGSPESGFGFEESCQRVCRRELSPIQQREAFLGTEYDRLHSGIGKCLARRHALAVKSMDFANAHHRRRHVARGARSPEAPTEPFAGITGTMPLSNMPARKSRAAGWTPELPRARLASFSATIRRATATGIGSPRPAAWERTIFL